MTHEKTIILAINDVEPGLVAATNRLSQTLDRQLTGLALVDKQNYNSESRATDETDLFQEMQCNFDNPDELQQILKPYMNRILAVVCRQEKSIDALRKVVPFLPYTATPSESSLRWSTEKRLMRDRLRTYDTSLVPVYQYFESYDEKALRTMLQSINYPVILKPNGLAASILVSKCDTPDEALARANKTFSVINDIYRRDLGRGKPGLLIEEMIQGDMYSTDAYVDPVGNIYCLPMIKVFTAHALGLEGFYNLYVTSDTDLSPQDVMAAHAAATSAVRALNLSATTTHIELFKSPNGWKIIELGPRMGGYRERIYREAYGVDHYYNDLLVKIGRKPIMPKQSLGYAAGFNLYAEHEGTIESIEGIEAARNLDSRLDLAITVKPGDFAISSVNGGKYLVDGVFSNKNAGLLQEDINTLRRVIQIRTAQK